MTGLVSDLNSEDVSSASSNTVKLDDLSIGGKFDGMIAQSYVRNRQNGPCAKTAATINRLCEENADIPEGSMFLNNIWNATREIIK